MWFATCIHRWCDGEREGDDRRRGSGERKLPGHEINLLQLRPPASRDHNE